MSARALVFLIAGMSASFLVVLLIVSAVVEPDGKRRLRRRAPRARVEMSPKTPAAETRRDERPTSAASNASPVSALDSSETTDIPAEVESEKTRRIRRAEQQVRQAAEAAQEFKIVRNELRQQIAALKQERKLMLAELAGALGAMSTQEAVDQIEALDEAAAVEVLRRTSQTRRNEILERLSSKRSRRLRRKL